MQCLAELADVILGPVGIGLVEAPAPKHTRGEGLRAHPGRRGDGLGLVGIDGRSPEQAVIGVATAVAREGGVGTAVEQATFCTLDLRSSSAVTQIFGLYWRKNEGVTPQSGLYTPPAHPSTNSAPSCLTQAAQLPVMLLLPRILHFLAYF